MRRLSLHGRPAALQWGALLGASLVLVSLLELMRLPAALLLGAMAAAILLAWFEGRVKIPALVLRHRAGSRRLPGGARHQSGHRDRDDPPVADVPDLRRRRHPVQRRRSATRSRAVKVLPGTTAVWGSSPGAATVMVLMANAFGGDMRLVAVMQYLRVACVGLVASVVARLWTGRAPRRRPRSTGSRRSALPFAGDAGAGRLRRRDRRQSQNPGRRAALPLFVGAALSAGHLVTITLPPWLLAGMLRAGRLVHRPQVHPRDRALRGKAIAADDRARSSP